MSLPGPNLRIFCQLATYSRALSSPVTANLTTPESSTVVPSTIESIPLDGQGPGLQDFIGLRIKEMEI